MALGANGFVIGRSSISGGMEGTSNGGVHIIEPGFNLLQCSVDNIPVCRIWSMECGTLNIEAWGSISPRTPIVEILYYR